MPKKKARRRANGEGSIYWFEAKKCYAAAITVSHDPVTGKPKRKAVYGKTQVEVKEKLLKLEMEKSLGTRLDQDKVTVGEWLDRWLVNYKKKQLRKTVYPSYEMNFRLHVSHLNSLPSSFFLEFLFRERLILFHHKIHRGPVWFCNQPACFLISCLLSNPAVGGSNPSLNPLKTLAPQAIAGLIFCKKMSYRWLSFNWQAC